MFSENARKHRASVNERQKNDTLPAPVSGAEPEPVYATPHSSLWSIFVKLWKYGLSVFMLFFVTLSCYPAVNSAIVSKSKGAWGGKLYCMVISIQIHKDKYSS